MLAISSHTHTHVTDGHDVRAQAPRRASVARAEIANPIRSPIRVRGPLWRAESVGTCPPFGAPALLAPRDARGAHREAQIAPDGTGCAL